MKRRMNIRTKLFILFMTLVIWGCSSTSKVVVWQAKDVAVANYKAFEVQPVINARGKPIRQDTLDFLTVVLQEEFEKINLQLSESLQTRNEILTVQTEILAYEPNRLHRLTPSFESGKALCILRTRLFQKSLLNAVGEIVTIKEINVGIGLFEPTKPEYVLKESAAVVAKEVAKMMW